jgi:hypothetical protein
MGMSSTVNVKQKILLSLDSLPPEGLQEVVNFLEYMRFKFQDMSKKSTQYKPIALGGLWKGETIDEKDIWEVRKEMWQSLENREL